jgi:hypothetical protein
VSDNLRNEKSYPQHMSGEWAFEDGHPNHKTVIFYSKKFQIA